MLKEMVIKSRLADKEVVADKIRGFIKEASLDNEDDLKEELEIVKQDIRTLKWVLDN
jgi:hypothetical protein